MRPGEKMNESGFITFLPDFEKRCKIFRKNNDIYEVNDFIRHIQARNYIPYIQSIITDDGDPISVASIPAYYLDDSLLDDLPKRQQKEVMKWIQDNLYLRKTPNNPYHSYHLKHIIEWDIGVYMAENQLKDAMLRSGYEPIDKYDASWIFTIGFKNARKIEKLERQGRFIP